MSTFKAHEGAGFGGDIKSVGVGCGSRAGKMEMHSSGKPAVNQKKCVGCGMCLKNCAHGAIDIVNTKAIIDHAKCVGCGRCIGACPKDAVHSGEDHSNDILNFKMVEYTAAVLRGRPHFHISLVMDVSPFCDCHAENDAPIVPDVGMFASFDPVALDLACAEAVNAHLILKNSYLEEKPHTHGDHFCDTHPTTNWKTQISHAEKMKLGSSDFELIKI